MAASDTTPQYQWPKPIKQFLNDAKILFPFAELLLKLPFSFVASSTGPAVFRGKNYWLENYTYG